MTATLRVPRPTPDAPEGKDAPSPGKKGARSPGKNPGIRVVLADDHSVVRRNLRLLLDSEEDVEVVAEAGELFTALRHLNGHMPHVLVLDLRAPDGSSLEAIRRMRAQAPETQIVVLTMEDNPAFARKAMDLGAAAYVLKHHADSELPTAVRCVAQGEQYVSPRVGAGLDALAHAVDGDGLTAREAEVLRLIALGFTSEEIAEQLCLSRRTVESHRTRIHRKLGVTKRSELVRHALSRHLIAA